MNSRLFFHWLLSAICGLVSLCQVMPANSQEHDAEVTDAQVNKKLASVLEALESLSISQQLRTALKNEVQNKPKRSRFPVTLKDGQRAVLVCEMLNKNSSGIFLPQNLSRITTMAVADLVRLDATVEQLISHGFDDRPAAEITLQLAARNQSFIGSISGLSSLATRKDQVIVAVALAKRDAIESAWQSEDTDKLLGQIYRASIHRRYSGAMKDKNWDDALADIEHLISIPGLAAPIEYLNAAKCYRQTDTKHKALNALNKAMKLFTNQADWQYFEAVGNELLKLNVQNSETQAAKAFELALKRLQKTSR